MKRLLFVFLFLALPARAHHIYVANDNHTDYGWNDTTTAYDAAMLAEVDYYLAQIAATQNNSPDEQMRWVADCWWYLWLYEKNRTAQQFQTLIDRMKSGHVTVPLNPMVQLYGAFPTEAAIRAGYYPGRIQRKLGAPFLMAQEMENTTIPWGIAGVWSASGVKYSWKGLCACLSSAPWTDRTVEVFRWQAPDNRELLMKWYQIDGGANESWGGYAEARTNLNQTALQAAIDRFSARAPMVPLTGLFGIGWDDVSYQNNSLPTLAQQWNAAHSTDKMIVSNEVDYFTELEGHRSKLTVLRGGWGNEWDLQPSTLAARTAQLRRALERLRTVEGLWAIAEDAAAWQAQQSALETAFVDVWKYLEHSWVVAGAVALQSMIDNKKTWANTIDLAVNASESAAMTRAALLFSTPNEDRFVVVNPLAFDRSDAVELIVQTDGPYIVTDVDTNTEIASQYFVRGAQKILRVLATVPPLGYRVYRYAPGTPAARPAAATVNATTIEGDRYKVVVGAGGKITSLVEKSSMRELAGAGLNDFGSGTSSSVVSEEVGPVSATMKIEVGGTPARRVRITLIKDVDRVAIDDEILVNHTALSHFRFDVAAADLQIRFEEVGAIAKAGMVAQGGNFQPGARVDYMTLNHFATISDGTYNVTLSNWDAFAMKIGASTLSSFDLKPQLNVLTTGNPGMGQIDTQGGDTNFRFRFALVGGAGAFSGAAAMRAAMAHQNPLVAIALPRNQTGKHAAPAGSFLAVSPSSILVTAFKPAEESDRGLIVRLWELDGAATPFVLDTSAFAPSAAFQTTAIETDVAPVTLNAGRIVGALAANEIRTYRFLPGTMTGTIDRDAGFDVDMLLGTIDVDAGTDLAMADDLAMQSGSSDGGSGGDMVPRGDPKGGCGCNTRGPVAVTGVALFVSALVLALARARRRKT